MAMAAPRQLRASRLECPGCAEAKLAEAFLEKCIGLSVIILVAPAARFRPYLAVLRSTPHQPHQNHAGQHGRKAYHPQGLVGNRGNLASQRFYAIREQRVNQSFENEEQTDCYDYFLQFANRNKTNKRDWPHGGGQPFP